MQELMQAAMEIACEAGEYIMESAEKLKQVDYKGRADLVTNVDRGSEDLIMNRIQDRYPDHDILAEESGGKKSEHAIRWVIDPIDGTTNFVHGYRNFCVSIAVQENAETVAAAVFNPATDEMFAASRGDGMFVNDQPIQVSETENLSESMVATGFPYKMSDHWHRSMDLFKLFYYKTHGVRRDGSAALDLAYVASGRFEGFWEYDLHPWDVAAGLLLVEEAGGVTTDFSDNRSSIFHKQVLATNGRIHQDMLDVIHSIPVTDEHPQDK
jgi:myo-inositol-1(or 4)-monophosphatase